MIREAIQPSFFQGRVLVWFSCGAASACAAKLTLEQYSDAEILYCDTSKDEHPDNLRFMRDVSNWIGKPIKMLRSDKYSDIYDVFDKVGWLVGHGVARCSIELKREVRERYQMPGDVHVFGMGADEARRIDRFERENPEIRLYWPLLESGMTKQDCFTLLLQHGIELPEMYKLGFKNNNCIGCVKGKAGYWNRIRVYFPDRFNRMAKQERKMNVMINNVFLDELPPDAGRYEFDYEIECGPVCSTGTSDLRS